MRTINKSMLSLAAAGLMLVSAAAQNTSGGGPGTYDPGHPRVNQVNRREARQQQRIANGIKDGQLNSRQAARLERGETRLQNQEKKDMAANNGHLTKQEHRQLNREANHMSNRIYKNKHK
jgi:hypothetical protein